MLNVALKTLLKKGTKTRRKIKEKANKTTDSGIRFQEEEEEERSHVPTRRRVSG